MMSDECGMMNEKSPAAFNSSFITPHSSLVLSPHARNLRRARGAQPVRADPHLAYHVPVALYEKLAARRAVGVLPAPDPTGKVPRVDEPQAGRAPDLAGAYQLRRGRVRVLRHPVVRRSA